MKKYITLGLVGLVILLTPLLSNQIQAAPSAVGVSGAPVSADAANCSMYKTDGTTAVYGTIGLNTFHFLICNGQTTGDAVWHLFTNVNTSNTCGSQKIGETTNWENSIAPNGVSRLMCQAPPAV